MLLYERERERERERKKEIEMVSKMYVEVGGKESKIITVTGLHIRSFPVTCCLDIAYS